MRFKLIALTILSSFFITSCLPRNNEITQDLLDKQATDISKGIYENLTAEAPTHTPKNTVAPSSTPDTSILYSDDFSTPSTRYDRDDGDGEIKQVNGELSINVTKINWLSFSTLPGYDYEDIIIDVDVYSIEGNAEDAYGIFCRSSSSAGYMFRISFDGYYVISLWEESSGFTDLVDYQHSSAINTGINSKNHITAYCHKDQLALKVNDVLLANSSNEMITSGDIDLFVNNDSFSNARVTFDNLMVTKSTKYLDVSDRLHTSVDYSCQSPGSISNEYEGRLVEICGEVTNWGEVPCPNCPLDAYSFITLDNSFNIISYEWVFNYGWLGDCLRISDTVEILGNDPVFTFGYSEGYAGSECTVDSKGSKTCSQGDYFQNSTICD